jgi:ankyrin repeat protein
MVICRFLILCALIFGVVNCRKKSEAVGKEVREAGYTMTSEGWFGAVVANDVAVMRKMTEGGFDVETTGSDGDCALHVAASAGAREAGEFLLAKGLPINAKGAKGRTPLMAAVTANQPEMVQWLLRQGADPKLKDDDGFMALMLAVTGGGAKTVEEIAPYHREDLDSALLLASLVGEAEIVDTLTNYGASVYARMEDGRTPLMLAAQNGHKETAVMLIDIGASRFATIESGETAQSLAVAAGHAEIAELIEKGFSGDALALESDDQVAESMGEYLDEFQPEPEELSGDDDVALANNLSADENSAQGSRPVPGEEAGQVRSFPEVTGDTQGGERMGSGGALASAALGEGSTEAPAPGNAGSRERVQNLGGATVSVSKPAAKAEQANGALASGNNGTAAETSPMADQPVEKLPLVMRHFRQRELPVEVKKVSGGVASLHLAGAQPAEVQVRQGEKIPGSELVVVRVFSRTEQGKLNNGESIEIGVVEVEDTGSGLKREWLEGRPASGHDPVALVEDAATGDRYLAKPGQKFRSEGGSEFIVNDVRPTQIVIEDVASGEVRTLPLRGPRG